MGYIEETMTEKSFLSPMGEVHYWVSLATQLKNDEIQWLVFLPGLTADHHMFDQQIAVFHQNYHCLVWDAPAHGASRPFTLDFSVEDLVKYLHDILEREQIKRFVLIGQSFGGYIAQLYLTRYPDHAKGFISVDSLPLERKYYAAWELLCVKHTKGMYRSIPWNLLVHWSAVGNAETEYGRGLMREMMLDYTTQEFCNLTGYGFRILAEAIEQHEKDTISCPVLLLCGEQDKAGFVKRYNKAWAKESGYPLVWIKNAGHLSNVDNPQAVNAQIEYFLKFVTESNK